MSQGFNACILVTIDFSSRVGIGNPSTNISIIRKIKGDTMLDFTSQKPLIVIFNEGRNVSFYEHPGNRKG